MTLLAICRDSKQILAFELGSRGLKTSKKLWENSKKFLVSSIVLIIGIVKQLIPAEKHLCSKAENTP